jgi:transposase-like protein
MASNLSEPHFQSADKAREYLEAVRWPHGPVCPHCGVIGGYHLAGKAHRPGLLKCSACREQFSVTVGTVFERSKIALHIWLQAVFLLCSSKKGMSSKQLERMLGVTYKTAWFMTHRIREAMKSPGGVMGGSGGTVEADETYVGGKEKNKHRSKRDGKNIGGMGKQMVFSLVERGGMVRSFHLTSVNPTNLRPVLASHVDTVNTRLMTDGEGQYRLIASMFKSHDAVNHGAGEYVRGEAYTNTVEGYFSILKRGIYGTFHSVSPQHLQRYCHEFDFRYNYRQVKVKAADGKWQLVGPNDTERTESALKGIGGKRLTYRRTDKAENGVTPAAH